MNAIAIYLALAISLYTYFKIFCDVWMVVGEEEINPEVQEIILIFICLFWIISIPVLLMLGKINHD